VRPLPIEGRPSVPRGRPLDRRSCRAEAASERNALALPESRDYSRVGDGDTGPNTGGMGSYSPVPELGAGQVAELVETIHRPVVEELAARTTPIRGCPYRRLMPTAGGPRATGSSTCR